MRLRKRMILLALFTAAACALFLLWGLTQKNIGYNLPRRLLKLAALLLTGGAIGFSTIIFQTVAHNRILTPSVMGLDSLYLFIQTLVIFLLGQQKLVLMSKITDFAISVGAMVLFSLVLFRLIFRERGQPMYTLVLTGIVLSGLFGSLSTFMQALIDPNEFLLAQDRMFASFNNISQPLLGISGVMTIGIIAYGFSLTHSLDVMSLGRDVALNLGIRHDGLSHRLLIMIAMLTSAATALVGPVTFLGLITANLSRRLFNTYRHGYLLAGAMLLSALALVLGQFLVERVLRFDTPLSVIINFFGGAFFIYLLLREKNA